MRRKTMLIVDDIDLNRTILNSCFSAEFNIVEAENGKEALTLLSKTQIDIIITDIMMPEMDGISLISALRKNSNFTNLPVIAITSRGEEYELKALKAGADDFVNKPFTPELLRHRVTSVLSQNKFQKHFLSHNFAYNSMKIPFAILRKNSDSTSFEYQYVNNSFAMIFKTTPDELVLEHKKIIDKNLLGFFTTMGTPVYTEHDTIYLEGPQKYYDIIAYIEENEFYCFTLKENTEREELIKAKEKEQWAKKEAKEKELYYDEIRQKDIILQNLIQNIPGGIGLLKIYDQNINIIYFSEGTPRLSGLSHDEYVEWIEDDLLKRSVHPDDLPLLLSEIKRAIPIGAPIIVTYRIYHKGGYYVWIMLHAIKIREEDGYPIYYAIFTSLPEEIIQYKILCERTPTALYVIEKGTHKILYENAQAKDLAKQINSQNETICYKKLYDIDEPCDFCPTSTLKGDSVFEKDVTIEKLGKHFIVKSQGINWYGKEAIASYITDETSILEEKKHAELLRQAQMANEAKTNFLARVSHDMRTPLHAILGLTYLSKDKNDTDKLKEDIIEIENAARLLLNLVNDTLDMGKIESNKLELHPTLCDEREVFNTIFNVMRSRLESKNIKFTSKEIGIDYKTMYFDVPRLQQIFINLLSNAVKFTPINGEINWTMECLEEKPDYVIDRFIIQDSGIGMSEEFIKHVFEPFSQENRINTDNNMGTGLGLPIVKKLVDLFGGTIDIKSTIGVGTTVTVILKLLVIDQPLSDNNTTNSTFDNLVNKRVLLCEDHPLNTKIIKKILEKQGLIVDTAENGSIGLNKFISSPSGYYDIVLMDIRMPFMNGIEATKAIRNSEHSEAKTVPIVALTANTFDQDIKDAIEAGMNEHLPKPVEPEVMMTTLSKMIRGKNI